jgi:hypothetical protein
MSTLALETRIATLETRLNHYRRSVLALGLMILGVVAIGAARQAGALPVADILRAKRIELVGEKGERRAYIGEDVGGGSITLFSAEGRPSLRLFGGASPDLSRHVSNTPSPRS